MSGSGAPDARVSGANRAVQGRVLIAGTARGRVFRLRAPFSFWGGVDPETGRISDPRHPDHGRCVAGRVLAVAEPIGSSSSSAVMLELLRTGHGPAALVLGTVDAILALGVVVAREMAYPAIPVLALAPDEIAGLPDEGDAAIDETGTITVRP